MTGLISRYIYVYRLEEVSEATYKRNRKADNVFAIRKDGYLVNRPDTEAKLAYLKIDGKHYKGYVPDYFVSAESFTTFDFHDINTRAVFIRKREEDTQV